MLVRGIRTVKSILKTQLFAEQGAIIDLTACEADVRERGTSNRTAVRVR